MQLLQYGGQWRRRLLCVAICATCIFLFTVLYPQLYLWQPPYDQHYQDHSIPADARRRFPGAQAVNHTSECRRNVVPALPDTRCARPPRAAPLVVYVMQVNAYPKEEYDSETVEPLQLAWVWDSVFSLAASLSASPSHSSSLSSPSASFASASSSSSPTTSPSSSTTTTPASSSSAFSSSPTSSGFSSFSYAANSDELISSSPIKFFPEWGIELRLIRPSDFTPQLAASITDLLLIGVSDRPWVYEQLLNKLSPNTTRVGFISYGQESCNNRPFTHPAIKYGFITYGDCALVDHDKWHHWPLGPKTSIGFPSILDPRDSPAMSARVYDIGAALSYGDGKPTRLQAYIALRHVCLGRFIKLFFPRKTCKLTRSLLYDLMSRARVMFGITSSVAQSLIRAHTAEYRELLHQSRLTICPAGGNPEQYRIWEAIMSGSIPVVELPAEMMESGTFVHPMFGTDFRCMPDDWHHVLRAYRAPVLFVRDWAKDLEPLLAELDVPALQDMQDRMRVWYHELIGQLRDAVFCQIIRSQKY